MQKIKNVLLIDDDTISSWLNKTMLERTELIDTIETIDAGQSAIEYLQQCCSDPLAGRTRCPDVILLDLDMPVVNGFDVLEALQKSDKCAWLISDRIIVLTTTINPKDLEKANAYDIHDFLIKPLTESKIISVLQEFINRGTQEIGADQQKSNSERLASE